MFAARALGGPIEVGREADVVAVLDQRDLRRLEALDHLDRSVGGGVVGDDDFEVIEALIEDALHRLPDVLRVVEVGDAYRKERPRGGARCYHDSSVTSCRYGVRGASVNRGTLGIFATIRSWE